LYGGRKNSTHFFFVSTRYLGYFEQQEVRKPWFITLIEISSTLPPPIFPISMLANISKALLATDREVKTKVGEVEVSIAVLALSVVGGGGGKGVAKWNGNKKCGFSLLLLFLFQG
jgi:hypothetical protein